MKTVFYKVTSDYIIFGNENTAYNLGDSPRVYQHSFSTKIDYNSNLDNDEWILTEEEQKLIKNFRELSEAKKQGILLMLSDDE